MRGAARWLAPLFFLLASFAFAAANYPPLTGRVVDQANIIPPSTRNAIETKLKDLEDKSGIQLVVASVNSLDGQDVETYANGLFRAWKLGEAKKNNGVLFLIAPNERKMRIEVGYGLEGTLTDALSKIIIATAVAPRFKARDFGAGVERGVEGIIEVLSGFRGMDQACAGTAIHDLRSAFAAHFFRAVSVHRHLDGAQRARPAGRISTLPPRRADHRAAAERGLLGR